MTIVLNTKGTERNINFPLSTSPFYVRWAAAFCLPEKEEYVRRVGLGVLALLVFAMVGRVAWPVTLKNNMVEVDILETVFRYEKEHCYRARSRKVYFLSYKKDDPPDALMQRFTESGHRVRKRSQMVGFVEKETGERGILLAIQSIKWLSDSSVEVRGTCAVAPLDGELYVYHLSRKGYRWVVNGHTLIGAS